MVSGKKTKPSALKTTMKVGAGLALGASAVAAALFFSGKKGAKHRKQAKIWTVQAKNKVLAEIENLKTVNKEAYEAIVESVSKHYRTMKEVNKNEVTAMASELKKHWPVIKKRLQIPAKKTTPRNRSKTAKKKSAK